MPIKLKNLLIVVLFLALSYGVIQISIVLPRPSFMSPYLLWGLVVSIVVWFMTQVFLKVENKQLADYGLKRKHHFLVDTVLGFVLGVALLCVMFGILFTSTHLYAQPLDSHTFLSFAMASVPVLFALALMEELIFRGYVLFKLKDTIGVRWSIYLTAVIFGLYHGLSFDAAFGPAIFGLIFGLMALWSKGLVLPVVFHFTINWIQAFFNMKTKYTNGMFELLLDEELKTPHADTVGMIIHVAMAIIAIILIEIFIRKSPKT